jgi:hypothetical protein
LVDSLEFYAMFPLEKYYGGVSNFGISPIGIAFLSRHVCNWLERFVGVLILVGIKCKFD